jgi:hypothetical protein
MIKTRRREGDCAELVALELVVKGAEPAQGKAAPPGAQKEAKKSSKPAEAKAAGAMG